MFGRKQLAILVAEFLGTGFLALIMLSVQHSGIGQLPYFVAIAAGLALATLTVVFAGHGGGHFNPVITIGMWTVGQIKFVAMLTYLVAQFLGAWAAYGVFVYFVKTSLQPLTNHSDAHIFFAEAAGALLLSLAYAAAVYNQYLTSKRAAAVGSAYALAILMALTVSIGIVNPAVALSMRAFDPLSTGWLNYVGGPLVGALVGFNIYAALFASESSLVRVRAAVSGRLGRSSRASSAAAEPAPARTSSRASSRAAKPAARRSSRTGRGRKTTRSRK